METLKELLKGANDIRVRSLNNGKCNCNKTKHELWCNITENKKRNETERGSLLEWFCKFLNPAREKTGYIPITIKRMAKMLEGIPTKDLYALQKEMSKRDYESASKYFWWAIKAPKDNG